MMSRAFFRLLICWTYVSFYSASSRVDKRLTYQLVEEQPVGTIVVGDLIRDAGLQKDHKPGATLSNFRFTFIDDTHHQYSKLFQIDAESGKISTAVVLDRDEICPQQLTCVLRLDVAVQPISHFEVIKIDIDLLDLNDNRPAFGQSVLTYRVSESTGFPKELFPIIPASDLDSPVNGVAGFWFFSDTKKFRLEVTVNGSRRWEDGAQGQQRQFLPPQQQTEIWDLRLILVESVDREEEDRYTLTLVAYDGGNPRRSGSLTLNILITDANDNSPQFTNATYEVTVHENIAIGSTLTTVSAEDIDYGVNGQVRYAMVRRSEVMYPGMFLIDSTSGHVILQRQLDYEYQSVYTILVVAEDSGESSGQSVASVLIVVLDVNDNAPEVHIDTANGKEQPEVSEHGPTDVFVALISVSDMDSNENGRVTCHLDSTDFVLDQMFDNEYKMAAVRSFDREVEPEVAAILVCTDHGQPALSVIRNITISITNIDDHALAFSIDVYHASLPENSPAGAFVATVSAVDADDVTEKVYYALGDPGLVEVFRVNSTSGVITTLVSLDRETNDCFEFDVVASFDGQVQHGLARAQVRVHVIDADDNIPLFTKSTYEFKVTEDAPPETEIGRVFAVDRDLWPFNLTLYEIDTQSSSGCFRIDHVTGSIVTCSTLDRETNETYRLTVRASSKGMKNWSDTASVFIRVRDVNDNNPVILFPTSLNSTVWISGRDEVGETVGRVIAYDNDIGPNHDLSYAFTQPCDDFSIDSKTGRIMIKRKLDFKNATAYSVDIIVSDRGRPPLNSTATLLLVFDHGGRLPASSSASQKQNGDGHVIIIVSAVCVVCFGVVVIVAFGVVLIWLCRRAKRGSISDVAWMKVASASCGTVDAAEDDDADKKMRRDESRLTALSDASDIILMLDSEPINYTAKHRNMAPSIERNDSGLDLMTTSVTSHCSADDVECMKRLNRLYATSEAFNFSTSGATTTSPTSPKFSGFSRDLPRCHIGMSLDGFPPPPSPLQLLHSPRSTDPDGFKRLAFPTRPGFSHRPSLNLQAHWSDEDSSRRPRMTSRHDFPRKPGISPLEETPPSYFGCNTISSISPPAEFGSSSSQRPYRTMSNMPQLSLSRKSVRFADDSEFDTGVVSEY